jgi:2',3'-cyclic-nucleotide 2'-phosphodiesterase
VKVLCIGDIVGKPGRVACASLIPRLVAEHAIDFVIANGENAAGGFGLTPAIADEILGYGVDVITTGNHVYAKKEFETYLDSTDRVLRPANWPPGALGHGSVVARDRSGRLVGVLNLQGLVFLPALDCPFRRGVEEIKRLTASTKVIIVDFHAEATAEKIALGYFLDGQCSAVFGTHTHVQTADETILPKGTGFISDIGMTGPRDSVIGMEREAIIDKFIRKMPQKFTVADRPADLCGAVLTIDPSTGRTTSIARLRVSVDGQ